MKQVHLAKVIALSWALHTATFAQEPQPFDPFPLTMEAEVSAEEQPESPPPSAMESMANPGGAYSGFTTGLVIAVVSLGLATFGLALYALRLTRLRLNTEGGTVISFSDSVADWMKSLEKHWNQSHDRNSENFEATVRHLQEIGTAFDQQGRTHFEKLVSAFQQHHNFVGTELKQMRENLVQTQEILASVQRIAEEKKEELEEYKAGIRVAASRGALGHLCDARDNLRKVQSVVRKESGESSLAWKALDGVDWELRDALENLDLVEIEAQPGTSIRDESLAGKYKILGKHPAPSKEYHHRIAEIIRHGYLIRIPRGDTEESVLFRPIEVTVYVREEADDRDAPPAAEAETDSTAQK